MKKFAVGLNLALSIMLLLTSIGFAQDPVTLRFAWWGGDSRHRATVEAIERYMELNPHVEIRPEYSGFSGYMDKLTTQFAGRTAPDIAQIHTASVIEYASRNLILDLAPYKNDYFRDIDESLWGGFTQDDKVWSIPVGTNVVTLVYNKTMFDEFGVEYPEPGVTFDELLDIAKAMTRDTNGNGRTDVFGIDSLFNPMTDYVHSIFYMNGQNFYSEDFSAVDFTSGAMANYIGWAQRFQEEGAAPSADDVKVYSGGQNAINQRDVAMVLRNMSDLEGIQRVLGDDELGAIPAPIEPTTGLSGVFLKPSQGIIVNGSSPNSDEAVKFLSWLLTSEEAAKIMSLERGVPTSAAQRAALADVELTEIQRAIIGWTEVAGEHADVIPQPAPPGDLEITTMVKDEELQRVFHGMSTLEEAVERMQSRAAQIIARNR